MELYEKVIEMALRDRKVVMDTEDAKEMCDMVMKALKELKEAGD